MGGCVRYSKVLTGIVNLGQTADQVVWWRLEEYVRYSQNWAKQLTNLYGDDWKDVSGIVMINLMLMTGRTSSNMANLYGDDWKDVKYLELVVLWYIPIWAKQLTNLYGDDWKDVR